MAFDITALPSDPVPHHISAARKAYLLGLQKGEPVTIIEGGTQKWTFEEIVSESVRVYRGGSGERFVSDGHGLERTSY